MGGLAKTVFILAGVLAGAGVMAVTTPEPSSSAYQGIVDRNVFNLHPPTAYAGAESAKPKVPIPKLTLNGITTILGKKLVVLTMPPTKPGTTQETLMLAEGQAQDEIEVREIDEKAGSVKVVNHGEEQDLDFEHDGTKPPPPGANPAIPMTIPPRPPGIAIPPPSPGNIIRPLRTLPSRTANPFSGNRNPFGGNQAAQ